MLTGTYPRCDSIALTKAFAHRCAAALSHRACPLRHLRWHLSQRERLL